MGWAGLLFGVRGSFRAAVAVSETEQSESMRAHDASQPRPPKQISLDRCWSKQANCLLGPLRACVGCRGKVADRLPGGEVKRAVLPAAQDRLQRLTHLRSQPVKAGRL